MQRSPLTPRSVIRTAADLADARGLTEVTLSAVARELDVRTPSLYGHVRDLAALRDGITTLALGEVGDRASEAVAGRAGRDALRALCDAHREYARAHPGRWESLQRRAGDAVARTEEAARSSRAPAAVLRGYGIPEDDRVHATRLIGSFLNGFLHLEHIGSFAHSAPPADDSWRLLIDRLHGLLAQWNAKDEK
ncbi:TetR-like C-terminal domain-containing protein [Microbacterium sp. KSW4-17]|uniref:TetR-like C-terminal domain-containing protein n=1 Tax=Microbacterium galbum TaxID=3075994 RepID=A0ABU3T7Y3_9MICO|nr:TetR-like C-terminal domain-containing protein [Microbacterium sp. KSW4-17]MDU0367480.1 TetR-like C-terminal domain-containing protein [Microbacterium sp. KSW4-17]